MLHIKTFPVNPIQMNCYIVSDETKQAVIIDCGAFTDDERTTIAEYISHEGLTPVAYLLTHAHFDHCAASDFVEKTYNLLPRMHAADVEWYHKLEMQVQAFLEKDFWGTTPPVGRYVDALTTIPFGNHTFSVFETPGHTPGGVCYYCAEERVVFTGDSLFRGTIGRTDFPGGSTESLLATVGTMLKVLPADVVIYPGHGPSSTVAIERNNPYFAA